MSFNSDVCIWFCKKKRFLRWFTVVLNTLSHTLTHFAGKHTLRVTRNWDRQQRSAVCSSTFQCLWFVCFLITTRHTHFAVDVCLLRSWWQLWDSRHFSRLGSFQSFSPWTLFYLLHTADSIQYKCFQFRSLSTTFSATAELDWFRVDLRLQTWFEFNQMKQLCLWPGVAWKRVWNLMASHIQQWRLWG